jgi:hemoglobin-like flavoprotein
MGAAQSGGADLDAETSGCPHGGGNGGHKRKPSAASGSGGEAGSSPTGTPMVDESAGSGCLWMRAALQPEMQVHPMAVTDTLKYSVTPPPQCPAHKQFQTGAAGTMQNPHENTNSRNANGSHSSLNQQPPSASGNGSGSRPGGASHKKNMSVSIGGAGSSAVGGDVIKATPRSSGAAGVASPTSPMPASSPQSPQSRLPIPSSPPFLGRPVQITSASPSRPKPINLGAGHSKNAPSTGTPVDTSSPPGTVNADAEWYGQAMILDSSDALWNAWMSTDSWLRPPWFVPNAAISAKDEALIKESIVALHAGEPFKEALRKENVKRQQARDREAALAAAGASKGLPSVSLPAFDPLTFLSFHFYEGLFFTLPAIRRQFKSPIEIQGKKMVETLVHMLTRFAAESRSNPDSDAHSLLMRQFKEMCRRHLRYQVKMNQYNMVGEALFHSLQYCIGEAWTPAMCSAWVRLYSFVVEQILGFMEQLAEEADDEKTRSFAMAAAAPPLTSSLLGLDARRPRGMSVGSEASSGSGFSSN